MAAPPGRPAAAGDAGGDLLRSVAAETVAAVGDEFLRRLVARLADAFAAQAAVVTELVDGEARVRAAFPAAGPEVLAGVRAGDGLTVALHDADGTLLGHLAVLGAAPMSADDERLHALEVLATRAAAEVERLRSEREQHALGLRLVEAGDAARRRIERNLHDGAQQRLVGLALSLRAAEATLGGDARTAEVLAKATEELQLTMLELRELARGIHPAVLSDRGLDVALEALATRAPLPVQLVLAGRRLPEPVEATAYYVIAEALTNVAKYAEATEAWVTVAPGEEDVHVEIGDDGVGGADLRLGTGLRGLADRVEALRGTLTLQSPPGAGTTVSVRIPLAQPPSP